MCLGSGHAFSSRFDGVPLEHGPGGEHADTYADEVAADCYSANTMRFNAGIGSMVLAVLVLSAGAALAGRTVRLTG